jgi:hypothetical protein
MLRASMFSAVLALGLAACATEDSANDELAGETAEDGETGKGDSVDAFDFFTADPDLRACSFDSRCGGFFVSRPNRSTTQCGRGVATERCYVDQLDWRTSGLPASVAREYAMELAAGKKLILKGVVAPDPADRGLSFAVKEVWVPRSDTGVNEGVAVLIKDNGIRCVRAPCFNLTEMRVNSNRTATISGVDFEASGADEAAIELGYGAMHAPDSQGVLVFGDRYYYGGDGKGRRANQFYTKAPVPMF